MSNTALQDAQWLQSLPQNLGGSFDRFFGSQPDEAKAWLSFDATFDDVEAEISSQTSGNY